MSKSTVSLSDRKKKYPKIGGPRKYPPMYCWSLNGNYLTIEEIRYFKSGYDYYFFKYENKMMTRTKRVPSDRPKYMSKAAALMDIPAPKVSV